MSDLSILLLQRDSDTLFSETTRLTLQLQVLSVSAMACESCRSQARTLVRTALRAGAMRAPAQAAKAFPSLLQSSKPASVRYFGNTSRRGLLGGLGGGIADSYRVVGATERIFKLCAAPADYYITPEERKKDQVERLEDGEEVGHAADEAGVWHKSTVFPCNFTKAPPTNPFT